MDKDGRNIKCSDELKMTRQYIRNGRIVAVKGIGGFNLICDGHNEMAIENLRKRKQRKAKPLALMMKDVDTVKKYCALSEKELKILTGRKKPIIILRKRNDELMQQGDATILNEIKGCIATSIDGFVVNPIFFPGGDIGKLSICGTVNDLSVRGAYPLYIMCSFILEEGLAVCDLEKIVQSMAETAKKCGVKIVAGDTKVVERGKCQKVYISTCGIGAFRKNSDKLQISSIKSGERIILSGPIGEHGMCILNERNHLVLSSIISDCAPLNSLCSDILRTGGGVRIMRDPTRGGAANTLNELSRCSGMSMKLYEERIPVKKEVAEFFDLIGLDPLYAANEGRLLCIVDKNIADLVLDAMHKNKEGREAVIIGEVIDEHKGIVYMQNSYGALKIIRTSQGEVLPRIC